VRAWPAPAGRPDTDSANPAEEDPVTGGLDTGGDSSDGRVGGGGGGPSSVRGGTALDDCCCCAFAAAVADVNEGWTSNDVAGLGGGESKAPAVVAPNCGAAGGGPGGRLGAGREGVAGWLAAVSVRGGIGGACFFDGARLIRGLVLKSPL